LFFFPPFLGASYSTNDFLDTNTSTFYFFQAESAANLALISTYSLATFLLASLALFQSSFKF